MIRPYLDCTIEEDSPGCRLAVVTIHKNTVQSVYDHFVTLRQEQLCTTGLAKGTTPLSYIEHTFKHAMLEHLEEFFLAHVVLGYLYQNILQQKIALASDPLLRSVQLDLEHGARYEFELAVIRSSLESGWKRLPFQQPTRKHYHDIDRQVELFLEDEEKGVEQYLSKLDQGELLSIEPHDFVLFDLRLVDHEHKSLMSNHVDRLWLRLCDDVVDQEAHDLFVGKKPGDSFITSAELFQEYVGNSFDFNYLFLVEIKDFVAKKHFSVEQFKKIFKLKTARELHAKLAEVFSFRNDITQRREIIEAAFEILLKHYPVLAPCLLVKQRQDKLLKNMHYNPDYNVYKSLPAFKQKIETLAKKLTHEQIIIAQLAILEHIEVTDEDIALYLNLTRRSRIKEFIHFKLPSFKENGREMPIPHELVRHYCLHEKTLNHAINYLTR